MVKISVIMPVYNTKKEYLKEAIESILNQTFVDFEFIVINDGSTDSNIEKVILSYNDSRIRYIKQENCGVAQSLNNAIAISQGEYIARMDADDISLPDRFKKQVEFLESHPDISLCGSFIEVFDSNKKRKVIKYTEYPQLLDCWCACIVAHPTVMFKKTDFEKYDLKYNPEYKCEDYELWSRAILHLKFYVIQEVLLAYRRHEENISFKNSLVIEQSEIVRENLIKYITGNKKLQKKLKNELLKNFNFYQFLFSIKNENSEYKVITILGIKIRIKRKKRLAPQSI